MRTLHAISAVLAGVALALPAVAQTGAPGNASGAVPKGLQVAYVLETGNQAGLLHGVSGLPSVASSASGAPPKGPPPPTVSQAELTLFAGNGLPAPFYAWVSGAIDARPAGLPFTIRGTDTTGRASQSAQMSNARVQALGFPALDANAGNVPMAMDVKTLGVLHIDTPAKPLPLPEVNKLAAKLTATRWLVSGYNLTIGKLDMSGVTRVEPFTLTPGGALNLQLTLRGNNTTAAVASIVPPPPIKGRPKVAPPALDAQLHLFAANGLPMATISLHQVVVENFTRAGGQDRATGGAVTAVHATLAARQATIAFMPAISQ